VTPSILLGYPPRSQFSHTEAPNYAELQWQQLLVLLLEPPGKKEEDDREMKWRPNKGPKTKTNTAEIGNRQSGNSFPLYLPKILTVEREWRSRALNQSK